MVVTRKISLESKGHCDIIDITPQVEEQVVETGVNDGTVTCHISNWVDVTWQQKKTQRITRELYQNEKKLRHHLQQFLGARRGRHLDGRSI